MLIIDEIAHNTGTITMAVLQIPNCPITFKNDPHSGKKEDSLLGYAWKQFLQNNDTSPEWIINVAMTKAGLQAMRAAEEFFTERGIANVEKWVVSGASKRGWTAFNTAMVNCTTCSVKIAAIAPIVPIVPNLQADIHRMRKAYGGYTFAFQPYVSANVTENFDGARAQFFFENVDPLFN